MANIKYKGEQIASDITLDDGTFVAYDVSNPAPQPTPQSLQVEVQIYDQQSGDYLSQLIFASNEFSPPYPLAGNIINLAKYGGPEKARVKTVDTKHDSFSHKVVVIHLTVALLPPYKGYVADGQLPKKVEDALRELVLVFDIALNGVLKLEPYQIALLKDKINRARAALNGS